MCYHCATNPSIHHHCCHITTVSSLLSHHGVTFTVTLSQFRHCHCDVAFIVTLLRCCCRSRVVAVPSLLHCRGFVVAVMVSPSSSHCRGFVIAVVVSPSHLSRFCCHHRGVAFVIALSWFCCRRGVAFIVALSQCRRHGFVVAIVVSPSSSHCCSVVIAVALLRWLCCHIIAVSLSPSPCHLHHHIVTVFVAISSSLLWCRLHRCIVTVSSLLLRCGHCC